MAPTGFINLESLLLNAEFIKKADLDYAVPLAKRMNLPLGRVLVSTGYIKEHTLNIALSAQSLVNSKSITLEICLRAMKEADKRAENLMQVLHGYGLSAELLEYTNKLGQLLVDSEFVTERQRVEALKMALSSSLPMGRIFVCSAS